MRKNVRCSGMGNGAATDAGARELTWPCSTMIGPQPPKLLSNIEAKLLPTFEPVRERPPLLN